MGFIQRLLFGQSENEAYTFFLDKKLMNGLDTLIYMEKNPEYDRDQAVADAIDEYLCKRIWAARDKNQYVTEITHTDTFKSPPPIKPRAPR